MKKLAAKIGLFIAINLVLINLMPAVWAVDCTLQDVKNLAGKNDCIPENDIGKSFITILEEPMGEEIKDGEIGETGDFRTITCYRKTITCTTQDAKPQLISVSSLVKADDPGCADPDEKTSCKEVTVIFSKGGTTMISGYVAMVYRWAAPIVGMICVLVIVVSGLQLSFSAGDSGAVDSARKRIVQSLAGLAVLFLSSVILYTVNPNFFTAAIQ